MSDRSTTGGDERRRRVGGSAAPDRSILFAEPPLAGRSGTHLTPPLPPDEAARVHEACLHDVVHAAARERGRIEIWFRDDASGARYFDDWFPHLHRRPRPDRDSGRWLCRAFAESFADGARRAVVVRADVPAPPAGVLGAAFAHLREVDAVLGPVREDGWYLVGVRADAWPRARDLFDGAADADAADVGDAGDAGWSGASARALLRRSRLLALSLRPLPGTYRLARVDDLRRARADVRPDSNLGRWLAGPEARPYIDA